MRTQGRVRINVNATLTEAVLADDRLDFRYVKPAITITGHVRSPGVYEYSEGLTVEKAIQLAGGLARDLPRLTLVLMRTVDGRATKITPKMSDVLQASDILEVRDRP